MMKTIKDYLKIYNLIDADTCNKFIDEYNKKTWHQHTWYSADINNTRTNGSKELDVINGEKDSDLLHPFIHQALDFYHNDIGLQQKIISNWSPIRFNRYSTGTIMSEHYDLIKGFIPGTDKNLSGIPTLTVLGILNDNFTGGELVFFGDDVINVKQGDIIVWPSTFLYPHKVLEVKNGTRYSFVSWCW